MKTLLRNFFLNHWERKSISLILAVIIWLVVNHSLTASKTIDGVAVRVINIPQGMTVEGLQANGLLKNPITLTLNGTKPFLDEITNNDLEVIVDATDKSGKWSAAITKKNLIFLNPEIDSSKANIRIHPHRFSINLARMVTEKIPVIIVPPTGEAPRDYQYVDVWPYHLNLSVSGSEDVVKQLKTKGFKLTFNLSNISSEELDSAYQAQQETRSDEVSFSVPEEWKKVSIPEISNHPIQIDDPQAKFLRINFVKNDMHPLAKSLPLTLFYPPEHSLVLNPENYTLHTGGIIQQFHGIPMIRKSLYAKGVSRLFVELVQDMVQIAIIVAPKSEKKYLDWSIQFINPKALEDRYVSILMSEMSKEEIEFIHTKKLEEHLRNRFRGYMNRFQLHKSNDVSFELKAELQGHTIQVEEQS